MLTSSTKDIPLAASGPETNIGSGVSGEQSGIAEAEIRAQLERIVASPGFAGSERLCRFIRWTVEKTLAGGSEPLRQYRIAREVFDRKAGFDPRVDSIVRTEAQRLRRRLSEYYQTEGREDEVIISFAPGTYVPAFSRRDNGPALSELGEVTSASTEPDRHWVAVLPFVNLSGEPEQDYLYQGITEAVCWTAWPVFPDCAVTARTSRLALPKQSWT